jgi:hypothetical protein
MMYFLASIPFWRPYVDLLWWQFAFLSLPYLSLAFAVVIAFMIGLNGRSRMDWRAIWFYYGIVALALFSFNVAIIQ